jgi:hypothetical protein
MNKLSQLFFLFAGLSMTCAGCASNLGQDIDFSCAEMPIFPLIEKDSLNKSDLIDTFRASATPDQLRIAELAADDVELFYQSQIVRLERACRPLAGEQKSVVAAGFIEMQSAALINSADLRNAPKDFVDALLPSEQDNLTARMDSIILSAVCSSHKHPLLAKKLSEFKLECRNP